MGLWQRRIARVMAGSALMWLAMGGAASAAEGDQRTTIFVGTTTYSDGTTSTFGTTFGAKWALEFQQDLQWTVGAAYATTDGQHKDAATGQVTDVHAKTTTVDTGLTLLFNNARNSNAVGFVGGGLSVISYDMDFNYPESKVGRSSGIGPGLFAEVGAEFRLSRSVWFIPAFVASAHSIKTEKGNAFTLVSTGLVISIRVGI